MVAGEVLLLQQELSGRGRGLVAAQQFQAGDIVLRDSPLLVYVASGKESASFCSRCLRSCCPSGVSTSCNVCKSASFCSNECKGSHLPHLCNSLVELAKREFQPDEQMLARFLLAAYNVALLAPEEFGALLQLEGEGVVDDPQVEHLHDFVEGVLPSWPWKFKPQISLELTAALLAKDSRNSFAYMSPCIVVGERSVRGYGVFPRASFLNHDCLPNTCRFDYVDKPGEGNTDIFLRALHDIPEKSEVTISYFPINWVYGDRQAKLFEEYGFVCKCERCFAEEKWSDVESGDDAATQEEEKNDCEIEAGCMSHAEFKVVLSPKITSGNGKGKVVDTEEEEDSFGHAMFFVKYLCPIDDCGGTMAPLPSEPSVNNQTEMCSLFLAMECNMCGHLRTGEAFQRGLEEHQILAQSE